MGRTRIFCCGCTVCVNVVAGCMLYKFASVSGFVSECATANTRKPMITIRAIARCGSIELTTSNADSVISSANASNALSEFLCNHCRA